ncbi:zinc finger, C2H2 type, partial [Cooperia oncophora]
SPIVFIDIFSFFLPEDECPYACKKCHRGFYTIKELAEHEIRAHDMKIPCAHCDKYAISVTKLAAHMLFRHASSGCCMTIIVDEKIGRRGQSRHLFQDLTLCKKSLKFSPLQSISLGFHTETVSFRNFPNCPGAKCIYSHGMCRYDITCNKSSCPFDHTNRPRVCMTCLNDLRVSLHQLGHVLGSVTVKLPLF